MHLPAIGVRCRPRRAFGRGCARARRMSACARFHRAAAASSNGRCLDCDRCWGRRWSASCGVRRCRGSARGSITVTLRVRPRARPGAPLDCAAWSAALPAWREVEAQMCESARRYGRGPRGSSRRCAGCIGGTAPASRRAEFAREQGLLQSARAYQRTLPRLALCAPRDRRAVALPGAARPGPT